MVQKTFSCSPSADAPNHYVVLCNDNVMRTPQGKPLAVPTERLAQAIMAEWQGQGDKIHKELFKVTPLACVAIDLAADQRTAVLADIVPYIDTDLVCYRAGDIEELLAKQAASLDPLIAWVEQVHGITLHTTGGLMPMAQSPENSEKLAMLLNSYDNWRLSAFSVAVKTLGSAVLALAIMERKLTAAEAYNLAHLEETYETKKWGIDDEKEKHLAFKRQDIQAVSTYLTLLSA